MDDKTQQDYEAAFAEATNDEAGESPRIIGEPESEAANQAVEDTGASETPPEAPATNPPEDIDWSNPEAAQAAYSALKADRDNLDHKVRSDDGRVSRFQRDRDEAMRKVELLTSAASQKDLKAFVDSSEWKKTKEEYGADLGPIFQALEGLAEQGQATQARFSQLGQDELSDYVAKNVEYLDEQAPGWLTLLASESFDPWLKAQPPHVQRLYENNREVLVDPDEVLDLVTKFNAGAITLPSNEEPATDPQMQPNDSRRAAQLEGSRSARSRSPGLTGNGGGDYDSYFQQYAAAEERAQVRR